MIALAAAMAVASSVAEDPESRPVKIGIVLSAGGALGLAFSVSRMFKKKDDAIVLKVEADFAGFRRWDHMLGVAEDELGHEFHVGAGPSLFIKTPLGPVQFKVGRANLYPQYNRDIPRWPTAVFISLGKDFRYTR